MSRQVLVGSDSFTGRKQPPTNEDRYLNVVTEAQYWGQQQQQDAADGQEHGPASAGWLSDGRGGGAGTAGSAIRVGGFGRWFGVYDGHCGSECSDYLTANLHSQTYQAWTAEPAVGTAALKRVEEALAAGFTRTERGFHELAKRRKLRDGSTACVVCSCFCACVYIHLLLFRPLRVPQHLLEVVPPDATCACAGRASRTGPNSPDPSMCERR